MLIRSVGLRAGRVAPTAPTAFPANDTFTDMDGTSLDAHTMDAGNGWTEYAADWSITSNRATYTRSTDGEAVAATNVGVADVTVRSVVRQSAGNGRSMGVAGRLTDVDNYWLASINVDGPHVDLHEKNAAVFTLRGRATVQLAPDTDHELVATFDAATITVTVGGAGVTYESATSNQAATRFGPRGFYEFGAAQSQHDDVRITEPEVLAPLVIAQDTFTDLDGTLITSHAPEVGPGWTVVRIASSGTIETVDIQGNALRFTSHSDAVVMDLGEADVTVTADWTPAAAVDNRNSVVFRYVDANNFWIFNVREPDADVNIYESSAGSLTLRGSAAKTFAEGTTYALKVVTSGATVTCSVDGVETVSYGSAAAHQTATKHGLGRNGGANETRMDNFEVTT